MFVDQNPLPGQYGKIWVSSPANDVIFNTFARSKFEVWQDLDCLTHRAPRIRDLSECVGLTSYHELPFIEPCLVAR